MALCLLWCPLGAGADGRVSDAMMSQWYGAVADLAEGIGDRYVGEKGHAQAEAYLMQAFRDAGFSEADGTLFTVPVFLQDKHKELHELNNIVGVKRAQSQSPRIVTVCAHYDSMETPGARDNASGVAAVLVLMRYFAQRPAYADTELRFIAFTAEETGHQGSLGYVAQLSEDERERSLAVFNIDLVTVDKDAQNVAFSVDSMGMRIQDGYEDGSKPDPSYNKAVRAMLAAMAEMGTFAPEDRDVTWCVPRHLGQSDHESFDQAWIDAVNVCFRGNVWEGGSWPAVMHTEDDVMGDFDMERTRQALEAVLIAVDGLSRDHGYGD